MFEFRVTKYDPTYRDRTGAYTREEWTSFSDIGREFDGTLLDAQEYQRVEDAYASAAVAFMQEAGVTSLLVVGLENQTHAPLPFVEGSVLGPNEIAAAVRRMLKEEFWCRLEGPTAFVHVGYDYYMYIGVPTACPDAQAMAGQLGLFVEQFRSPYRE